MKLKMETILEKNCLWQLMNLSSKLKLKDFYPQMNHPTLNSLQTYILLTIFFEKKNKITPKDLSIVLKVTKSHLGHSLSELESLKLIQRTICQDDARRFFLTLTNQGSEVAAKIISPLEKAEKSLEKQLGSPLYKQFQLALNILWSAH